MMMQPISDALFTAILFLVGLVVLAVSSVVLALRAKGDRSITWSGFGVCFNVTPCVNCRLRRKSDAIAANAVEREGGRNGLD